jgi:hypothetical protein
VLSGHNLHKAASRAARRPHIHCMRQPRVLGARDCQLARARPRCRHVGSWRAASVHADRPHHLLSARYCYPFMLVCMLTGFTTFSRPGLVNRLAHGILHISTTCSLASQQSTLVRDSAKKTVLLCCFWLGPVAPRTHMFRPHGQLHYSHKASVLNG